MSIINFPSTITSKASFISQGLIRPTEKHSSIVSQLGQDPAFCLFNSFLFFLLFRINFCIKKYIFWVDFNWFSPMKFIMSIKQNWKFETKYCYWVEITQLSELFLCLSPNSFWFAVVIYSSLWGGIWNQQQVNPTN